MKKLERRFYVLTEAARAHSCGHEHHNIVQIDWEIGDILTTFSRFAIVNDAHVEAASNILATVLMFGSRATDLKLTRTRDTLVRLHFKLIDHLKASAAAPTLGSTASR